MAAEPSLRHRLSTQARAVRTRIAVWVVLLTALALLGAGLAAYLVVSERISERIGEAIQQEIAEFETLRQAGVDPDTGGRFTTAERLMEVSLLRQVPDDNEHIVVFLNGEPAFQSLLARPEYDELPSDPAFQQAVRDLLPRGGARRVETGLGEVVMAVKPVNDATTTGAYVPVYFTAPERAELESVLSTYALVAAIALLLVTAGAWLVSGRLLKPLREMRTTAQDISDTDLSRRLDTTGNDDITELGDTFNAMLDRLEQSFAQQRRFLDDAGHELRTPITIVRGHLELLDPEQTDETEATRDLVMDEVDRMARLVDDMIILAKSGRPDFLQPTEVDAGILTDEVLDKVRALGDREWKLDERAEGAVCVDPQRVTQALVQLAKNAVQHTASGDVIAVGSHVDGQRVRWWVRDTGPGIEPRDADRIFERFQRGGEVRGSEGSGLGLSIVRAIATSHGGDVHLESTPGEGATFTLDIPTAGRPEHPEVG
ncbi:MAG TPA: HAMP domain-containing sensor histidine kinase [Nocardioidaceae bacterium]|nr:HAMP domain-containing sensor histidine kinase [Nocardioidaceae bacterium]